LVVDLSRNLAISYQVANFFLFYGNFCKKKAPNCFLISDINYVCVPIGNNAVNEQPKHGIAPFIYKPTNKPNRSI